MHIVVDLERLKTMIRMRPFQSYLEKARRSHENPCWNCGDKSHYKDKCLKPIIKKEDSPKKASAANGVVESDSADRGAFFMEDDKYFNMPDL